MAYENSAGIDVSNHYGTRDTGYSVGVERSTDSIHQLSVVITGESLNDDFLPPIVIPKGAHFLRYILTVDEAFVVSTGGTVAIGGTAPGTNGIVLTEAVLEAQGVSDVTALSVGTWAEDSATGTTAAEAVTKAVTGTVGATAGRGTLTAEYIYKVKP